LRLLMIFLLFDSHATAQRFHIGLFGGVSAYNGDLTDKIFPKHKTKAAIGISGNYEYSDRITFRVGLTHGKVGGDDQYSEKEEAVKRNLSFETSITELSALAEYYFYDFNDRRFSPYVFAGLAVFHFNPYAYKDGEKIFLQPLGTEGQGLAAYPDRKPYSLTQLAIPLGGGLKYAISDRIRIAFEVGLRKLFTDYLDDVSKYYPDPNDLLAGRGQLTVDMSYRGDELADGDPAFPPKSIQRGNEKLKDWYYLSGIHLTFSLGSGNGTSTYAKWSKKKYGCPVAPL
jgi:hypothetical protein